MPLSGLPQVVHELLAQLGGQFLVGVGSVLVQPESGFGLPPEMRARRRPPRRPPPASPDAPAVGIESHWRGGRPPPPCRSRHRRLLPPASGRGLEVPVSRGQPRRGRVGGQPKRFGVGLLETLEGSRLGEPPRLESRCRQSPPRLGRQRIGRRGRLQVLDCSAGSRSANATGPDPTTGLYAVLARRQQGDGHRPARPAANSQAACGRSS